MTRLLDRVPASVLRRIDSWPFWMTIAYFAIVGLTIWLVAVQAQTTREEATRKATAEAALVANYRQCVQSIPQMRKVNTFLEGVHDLADTLTQNSLANVQSTPSYDPQLQTRLENLRRLMRARDKVAAVLGFPIPTETDCKRRYRQ